MVNCESILKSMLERFLSYASFIFVLNTHCSLPTKSAVYLIANNSLSVTDKPLPLINAILTVP